MRKQNSEYRSRQALLDEIKVLHKRLAEREEHAAGLLSQQEPKENNEIFRHISLSLEEGVALTDESGLIIEWNPALERICGFSLKEVLGQPLWAVHDWLDPQDPKSHGSTKQFKSCVQNMLTNDGGIDYQRLIKRRDGSVVWVESSIYRIKTAKDIALVIIARDITHRRKAEETKSRLAAIVGSSNDAIVAYTLDEIITDLNPAMEMIYGRTAEEVIGNHISTFVPPDRMHELQQQLERIKQGEQPERFDTVRVHKNGNPINLSMTVSPIRNELGKVIGISAIARDITQQKLAEKERERLLAREQLLSRISRSLVSELDIERVPEVVLSQSLAMPGIDGATLHLADPIHRVLGLLAYHSAYEDVGRAQLTSHLPYATDHITAHAALTEKTQVVADLRNMPNEQRPGHEPIIEDVRSIMAIPLLMQSDLVGMITFYSCSPHYFSRQELEFIAPMVDLFTVAIEKARLYRELHVRERQMALLVKRTFDAQEKERQRIASQVQESVSQVLAAAVNYLQALHCQQSLPSSARQEIENISALVHSGLEEVLQMTAALRPRALDVLGLVATLRQELFVLASRSGCVVDFDAEDLKLPKSFETGIYRIVHEALDALVEHGNVRRARVCLTNEGGNVILEIQDDDVGVDSLARDNNGMPMGLELLSIRERVELLGGTLTLCSQPEMGICLRVEIPCLRLDEETVNISSANGVAEPMYHYSPKANPITVLVVDDHSIVKRGLCALLETDDQIQVVGQASDGSEAIERTRELHPQVVLMDINMPKMDGIEATRIIKETCPSTAVIMLTSFEDEALLVSAIQAGAAGYLLKGISFEQLDLTIRRAISGELAVEAGLLRQAISNLVKARGLDKPHSQLKQQLLGALTKREVAVLRYLAEGWTNKAIGDELGLAEITVKRSVQGIIKKLKASDRTHAAIVALRYGLIE